MAAIVRAIIALFSVVQKIFNLTRPLFRNISALLVAYWPKIVAALTAAVPFFIDRFLEYLENEAVKLIDKASDKVDDLEELPFPDIPPLSELYYSIDPELLTWLEAFRVSESLGIISAVVTWKFGAGVVARVLGKF